MVSCSIIGYNAHSVYGGVSGLITLADVVTNEPQEEIQDNSLDNLKSMNKATPSNAIKVYGDLDKTTPSNAKKVLMDMPEFSYISKIAGYEINIYAEENVFPKDTEVVIEIVKVVNNQDIENVIKNNLGDNEQLSACAAFNITFYCDGEEIQPKEGTVQVSIKFASDINIEDSTIAKVFHIDDESNVEEISTDSFEESTVTYQAEEFSVYAVALVDMSGYIAINSAEELHNINNNLNANYILMSDIDLSGWGTWEPIGSSVGTNTSEFEGNFEGNGHTISNLHLDVTDAANYSGLFGRIRSGSIKNLTISNVKVSGIASETSYIGVIAGRGNSIIDSCKVDGIIDIAVNDQRASVMHNIGGIIGYTTSGISNCNSNISMVINHNSKGALRAGGISGSNDSKISNSMNYGTLKIICDDTHGYDIEIGGISGGGTKGIEQCANHGEINVDVARANSETIDAQSTSLKASVGGIRGTGTTILDNCYNAGKIFVDASCVNTGIKGAASMDLFVGGISGDSAKAYNCYNIGQINCHYEVQSPNNNKNREDIHIGNITGYQSSSNDERGYYYVNSQYPGSGKIGSDNTISDPYTALTNSQMQMQENYVGFDFDSIWKMGNGDYKYPIFQWQQDTPDTPDIPEKPDENQPLTVISVYPLNGATGVKTTDRIMIEFNKPVNSKYGEDNGIYIKDYDTDEIIYKTNLAYFGIEKIFIDNALKNCASSRCYIYIPENAFYSKIENQDTGDITQELFKGIINKDEYSFWMESDKLIFTATFDTKGGNNVGNRSFREGTQVKRPNDPYKEGYKFTGWFSDQDCTISFDFNTLIYNDITLYAGWNKLTNTSQGNTSQAGESVNSGSSSDSNEESSSTKQQDGYNYSDNWKKVGGNWQCFDKDGNKYIGYQEGLYWNGIKGNWYFDQNGNMQTGWHEGKYFNETSNGYNGIEITNMNIVNYTQGGDAGSTIGQYSYAITFVDDIDWRTKINSSVKNHKNEFKSIIVGLWNSVTTNDWDITQNIADAYMQDPVSNKAFLADVINEMFSTETWRENWDGSKTLNTQLSVGSIFDDLWSEVKSGIGNELNAAKVEGKNFDTIKKVLDSSEEIQKIFTDYSQNIEYLESLKVSVNSNSVLGEAIDNLIRDYKSQSIKSISKVVVNALKISNTGDGVTQIIEGVTSDDYFMAIGEVIAKEVVGLEIGKVDAVIQLAYSNSFDVSAVDKVVYSSYLRSNAIGALKKAEEKVKSENNAVTMKEYKNAFECARLMTLTQYENMLKYYKTSSYNEMDKYTKINYLDGEIAKLKEMTFINYVNKGSKTYNDYAAGK